MKKQILNFYTNAVIFECDVPDTVSSGLAMRHVLEAAVKSGANLRGAYLRGANLRGANLSDANLRDAYLRDAYLSDADLRGAYLRGAYLSDADLRCADLSCANLSDADLRCADLSCANLSGANLRGANLSDANLRGANLSDADLRDADLSDAYLRDAYLRDANLSGAKNADYAIAQTRILPDGDLIGWKKCKDNVIVKLLIPETAKRSHAFGRKCRAEYADVLEVFGEKAVSQHDGKTEYVVGTRVYPDSFSDDWQEECANGIHFFITRIEAENY